MFFLRLRRIELIEKGFYQKQNTPVQNNLEKFMNIFDRELSRRVPDRSQAYELTDFQAEYKAILRLLVFSRAVRSTI